MRRYWSILIIAFLVLVAFSNGEIKLIESSATTLEWNLASVLKAGKKYSVEVLLNAPTGNVRVIDEPLSPRKKTYRAINLKSNKPYQIKVYPLGQKGKTDEVISRPSYTNLRCYSCSAALSADFCTKLIDCSPNERQCYTRVRYFNGNGRSHFAIYKGCTVATDVCRPNQERIALTERANSEVGDLTTEQVLQTMPGLNYFQDIENLLKRSPAIMKQVKKKFEENKKADLENALKDKCSSRSDPDHFCRCCCSAERCNHAMLDCGVTQPPDYREEEPLPPDIATTRAARTFPTLAPRKVAPVCRDFNGGCDHVCIPLNKTAVRCGCHEKYKLHEDGKTCTTHLKHAVADAGPDITITLPQDSIILTAKNTKGSVKNYKWWDPVASGENAGLTISDTTQRELHVTDLRVGEYKFILMVTGMDGRRTSDVMTLTVEPNPGTTNATEAPKKPSKLRPRVLSFNRYRSRRHRKEWKNHVKVNGLATTPPTTSQPRLRFSAKPRKFTIIRRRGGRQIPTTTTTTAATIAEKPKTRGLRPGKPRGRGTRRGTGTGRGRGRGAGSRGGTTRGGKKPPPKTGRGRGRGRGKPPTKPKSVGRGSSRSRGRGRGRGAARLRMANAKPKTPTRGVNRNSRSRGRRGSRRQDSTRRSSETSSIIPEPTLKTKRTSIKKPTKPKGQRASVPTNPLKPDISTTQSTNAASTAVTTTTATTKESACLTLDSLEQRKVTSTCSNSTAEGSECEFECTGQRTLQGGSSSVTCGLFGEMPQWMNGPSPAVLPCCELGCPANAFADVVFLIHSGTKTGRADWTRILNFVYSMVGEYIFGKDGVCVGAVRYHRIADARSEVGLDCTRSKAAFKQSLLRMPFAGVGSNTGAGLTHLRTKSFNSPNNRPRVQDVAVVITDSKSSDDSTKSAATLKRSGVKVHVIGLKTRGGTPNFVQMKAMASFPSKVINIPRTPPSAPPVVKTQLRSLLCVKGCERYDTSDDTVHVAKPKSAIVG